MYIHLARLFLILLLIPAIAAAGTNYYVRLDGNDTACNGKVDAPYPGSGNTCAFRTVQKGVDAATLPGDVLNIRGDHSSEGLIITKASGCTGATCGTSPTYITIQSAPGTSKYGGIINPGISIRHDYIIVQDLGIAGSFGASSGYAGVSFNGSHNKVLKNHFYNPKQPIGSSAIVFASTAHFNTVDGNLIEGDTNPSRVTGHHTGNTGAILSDSFYTWAPNQWQGRRVWNLTPAAASWAGTDAGTIISNDEHSFTTSLGITWNTNDCYVIGTSYWIPFQISGTDNTISNNKIQNLADTERVFDGMANGSIIYGNEVSDLLNGNEIRGGSRPLFDNCNAHPDLFQLWDGESINLTIDSNYFHDLQSQTGILQPNGHELHDWILRNNVFANITQRQSVNGPGFKWYNNTFFNVAQEDQVNPLEEWFPGVEYKNNVIIGGSSNPNYGMIMGTMGSWTECAKNVITKTWKASTDRSYWVGQSGTQALLTAGGKVYVGTGAGGTGTSAPNWAACATTGSSCSDNGITWTNIVWNTLCTVTGMKEALMKDPNYSTKKMVVTQSFTCSPAAFPDGDPNIYDAEGIKTCHIKDASEISVSNNYYGIWNPPIYSPRSALIISQTLGDPYPVNGGDPRLVNASKNCVDSNCDFHLRQGSPLIGAGINLSSVWPNAKTKDGSARPLSGAWAIGAYEFSDSKSPNAPLGLTLQ